MPLSQAPFTHRRVPPILTWSLLLAAALLALASLTLVAYALQRSDNAITRIRTEQRRAQLAECRDFRDGRQAILNVVNLAVHSGQNPPDLRAIIFQRQVDVLLHQPGVCKLREPAAG